MKAREYEKMEKLAKKLRTRGIELAVSVENGVMKLTAGRAAPAQETAALPELVGVGYI